MNENLTNRRPRARGQSDGPSAGESEPNSSHPLFDSLIAGLTRLQRDAEGSWYRVCDRLGALDPENLSSARNLVHYLALRRHDIRELQNNLARNGISSLGRSESHVMSNLNKVLKLLHRIVNRTYEPPSEFETALSLDEGADILERRTAALLGPQPKRRKVRVMVTLSTEAADNYALVRDLVAYGMDCARINCAHDGPVVWERMVKNISRAKKETGRPCKICFDIAGPKLRTGAFEPGPQVIKLRPMRDMLGRVVSPARAWVAQREKPVYSAIDSAPQFTLPERFIRHLKIGDKLKFKDARRRSRSLHVTGKSPDGVWLETDKTSYIIPETKFRIANAKDGEILAMRETAGRLAATEQYARLHLGDIIILTRSQAPGRPAQIGPEGNILAPARVPCTLPEVFNDVKVGEKVWFDDGKLGGVISSISDDEIVVKINRAGPKGHRLGRDKGINLPDSNLKLGALTDTDRENLRFIVKHADVVSYSFVRTAEDVRTLLRFLREMTRKDLGIVLKIETRTAFENLPELLLAAMETSTVGVMIARGDLAVEVGFERMAEIQEEILWMCEAAHVPVIWATQVLEQLSKKGVYSRAEITDAAMSERADCVMLNKGPYILNAVQTLDNVLRRMESHQKKKRAMMRPLKLAERFFAKEKGASPIRRDQSAIS
jgi:pyruvate kinase